MANSVSRTHAKVRGLVITAMLAAVSTVLAVTPLGFINIGCGLGGYCGRLEPGYGLRYGGWIGVWGI